MGRVVLVTGVCRDLGGRFARRMASHPEIERVIGVDVIPPRRDLGAVRFVRADIRNPVIAKVIAAEDVDTVVHLGVIATPAGAGGRALMKEINVIGTMQLLAACQRAPGVQRLIVKSSSRVYGSSPRDPAMFSEDADPRRLPRAGFGKDSVEVEGYVRGFARRRPDVVVTMLRLANVLGADFDTALTKYLTLPVVPTVLGFDARLQFCHVQDALAVLDHATGAMIGGTFNIAGDGVMMLSSVVRRLGRPSLALPAPAFGAIASLVPKARGAELSTEQAGFLAYGRVIDTTRMREVLGFEPDFTTAAAFEDFARGVAPGPLNAERLQDVEHQVTGLISKVVSDAGR